MTKVTKEEVIKIAHMARIAIHEDELEAMVYKLQAVLTYAERVKEIAVDLENPVVRPCNVFRQDTVKVTPAKALLSQAPEREENYFVVPKVLGGNS